MLYTHNIHNIMRTYFIRIIQHTLTLPTAEKRQWVWSHHAEFHIHRRIMFIHRRIYEHILTSTADLLHTPPISEIHAKVGIRQWIFHVRWHAPPIPTAESSTAEYTPPNLSDEFRHNCLNPIGNSRGNPIYYAFLLHLFILFQKLMISGRSHAFLFISMVRSRIHPGWSRRSQEHPRAICIHAPSRVRMHAFNFAHMFRQLLWSLITYTYIFFAMKSCL